MKKNKRFYQYEMIRIIAMFMVVVHHICVHGSFPNGLSVYQFNSQSFYIQSLSAFGKVGVFLFMMITGFFVSQAEPKLKKIWPILVQTTFYLGIGYFVLLRNAYQMGTTSGSDLKQVFSASFYPFTGYWFVNAYLILYALTPFLNLGIKNMNQKVFQRCLLVMTIILCFSGVVTKNERPLGDVGLVLLPYLFGSYYRKYPLKIKKRKLSSMLIILLLILNLEIYLLDRYGERFNLIAVFDSPIYPMRDISLFVVSFSVILFLLLQQIQIRSVWIQNRILQMGKCMLGVYLLHDNRIIRPRLAAHLSPFFNVNGIKIIFPIIAASLVVFIFSAVFEKIRQLIFNAVIQLWKGILKKRYRSHRSLKHVRRNKKVRSG